MSAASKFRVVFDCSAKFQNKSLNDRLLVGPDLTCNLLGVLLRFREHPIAVVGDIKAMFSQVLVDEADCDVFRFLWYPDDDLTHESIDYRMLTHVFGAKSSPCCAAYALRATAHDNLTKASETRYAERGGQVGSLPGGPAGSTMSFFHDFTECTCHN